MKYYYDCEFLEGAQKRRIFGWELPELFDTVPTIDLISIGVVAEDGREFYAVSKDFNLEEAWNRFDLKETSPAKKYMGIYEERVYWIRENVLFPIFTEMYRANKSPQPLLSFSESWALVKKEGKDFTYSNFKKLINKYGKTNKQIAEEVYKFCKQGENKILYHNDEKKGYDATHPGSKYYYSKYTYQENNPEFYAYYADYDWVAFCWLFGKMMDLPKGFPMYCRDLKQELDRVEEYELKRKGILRPFKELGVLPKQTNEHNALDDAKWNRDLHNFLLKL